VENVPAAFTDHLSVVIRLTTPIVRRGKLFWKMNTSILSDEALNERLRQKWALWRRQRRFYTDWPMLWGRYKKTDSSFLYSGRDRTSAELREDREFVLRVHL